MLLTVQNPWDGGEIYGRKAVSKRMHCCKHKDALCVFTEKKMESRGRFHLSLQAENEPLRSMSRIVPIVMPSEFTIGYARVCIFVGLRRRSREPVSHDASQISRARTDAENRRRAHTDILVNFEAGAGCSRAH